MSYLVDALTVVDILFVLTMMSVALIVADLLIALTERQLLFLIVPVADVRLLTHTAAGIIPRAPAATYTLTALTALLAGAIPVLRLHRRALTDALTVLVTLIPALV